jgi:hypothetical protein
MRRVIVAGMGALLAARTAVVLTRRWPQQSNSARAGWVVDVGTTVKRGSVR